MPVLYYVNITIHILAAMLSLGGMFFLGVVGAPVLSPAAIAFRTRAAVLARINALLGVLLVAAAVRLARGG